MPNLKKNSDLPLILSHYDKNRSKPARGILPDAVVHGCRSKSIYSGEPAGGLQEKLQEEHYHTERQLLVVPQRTIQTAIFLAKKEEELEGCHNARESAARPRVSPVVVVVLV